MNNTKFYNLNVSSFAIGSSGETKIYLGSNLIYEQEAKTITAMTLDNLVWVTNISWSGGTANSANCSYEVTAYYDDGTTGDVTSSASVYGSQVVPKSYVEGAHSAGTLTLTPAFSGYTRGASTTIMQNSYNRRYHPLVFEIISGGTIMWRTYNDSASANACTIEYKLNDADWSAITATYDGVTINVNAGDEIQFKGDNTRYGNSSSSAPWVGSSFCGSTATFDLHGNIMALIDSDSTVYPSLITLSSAAFCRLFGNTLVRCADGLYLPATTLASYCYDRLFFACPNLISAPALPATTLATQCYNNMFRGCTSLTTAPDLLVSSPTKSYCYRYMFSGCTSLNYIKCLATTNTSTNAPFTSWVADVPSGGTFVRATAGSWDTGANGIPSGWTIEYDT